MRPALRRLAIRLLVAYVALEVAALIGLQALGSLRGVEYGPLSLDQLSPQVEREIDRLLLGEFDYLQLDPVLGWSQRANGSSGLYRANSQGLRSQREYTLLPPAGSERIASFGDSFTHGDDVEAQGTWQVSLESKLAGTEVLNFGVPAYGPGQAYLRYQEHGRSFQPTIVLIGFMTENIQRAINVWRPFYRSNYSFPLTKPRFAWTGAELQLHPNPLPSLEHYRQLREQPQLILPRIAQHDGQFHGQYHSSALDLSAVVRLTKLLNYGLNKHDTGVLAADGSYNLEHEGFEVITQTLKAFSSSVAEDGARPLIVLFPDEILAKGSSKQPAYQALRDWLEEEQLDFVDLQAAFDRYNAAGPLADLRTGNNGHYSAKANAMVASFLGDELLQRGWVRPEHQD